MITLRDYQERVYNEIISHIQNGVRSILVVMPCRSGKTPLATYITDKVNNMGGRVLFNVHRKILLEQTSNMFTANNIKHGILSPEYKPTDDRIQVASVMTLNKRFKNIPTPNIIISDEAHRDKSATREKILKHFDGSVLIGLTATPKRLSGEALGDVYEKMVIGPDVIELINKGHLTDFEVYSPPTQLNFSNLRMTGGDFNKKALSEETNTKTVCGDAIKHYLRLTPGMQTCTFCVDINHAKTMAEEYRKAGIPAEAIHSKMSRKEQQSIVKKFVNKEIKVITNVDMITEGYDCPGIDVVQLLRKTMSIALHVQMSTRGMTPREGKSKCIILDHVGNTEQHGTVDMDFKWSLEGETKLSKAKAEEEFKIKTCNVCWHTYEARYTACPFCGHTTFREPVKVKILDYMLEKIRSAGKVVSEICGWNLVQGVPAKELEKRLLEFKRAGIPRDSKHWIKVEKALDIKLAKTIDEIIAVAHKWEYNQHWIVDRYMAINRFRTINKADIYRYLKNYTGKEHTA